jgi:hypothetical protein
MNEEIPPTFDRQDLHISRCKLQKLESSINQCLHEMQAIRGNLVPLRLSKAAKNVTSGRSTAAKQSFVVARCMKCTLDPCQGYMSLFILRWSGMRGDGILDLWSEVEALSVIGKDRQEHCCWLARFLDDYQPPQIHSTLFLKT